MKNDKKPAYTLCPRCELNYFIPSKKDKYCTVCKAEMGLLDKSAILLPDEEEVERLCPICKVNFLADDEDICFVCQKEHVKDDGEEEKEWVEFEAEPEEVAPDELEISLELVAEEEEKEEDLFDEENDGPGFGEPDDFDFDVDPNDYDDEDLDDEDLDDEDDED